MSKTILDLCGGTGAWSEPYRKAGYNVKMVTLPEKDVRFYVPPKNVYGILAAPPCDQFSFAKTTGCPRELNKAIAIVSACLRIVWLCNKIKSPYAKSTTLKFWALENPDGLLKRFLGNPATVFDPFDFGDRYSKKTHLWGYFNLPKKSPVKLTKKESIKFDRRLTKDIHGEFYGVYDRKTRRAITPKGFAESFFKANR